MHPAGDAFVPFCIFLDQFSVKTIQFFQTFLAFSAYRILAVFRSDRVAIDEEFWTVHQSYSAQYLVSHISPGRSPRRDENSEEEKK
jgi:hypothetical protein